MSILHFHKFDKVVSVAILPVSDADYARIKQIREMDATMGYYTFKDEIREALGNREIQTSVVKECASCGDLKEFIFYGDHSKSSFR